MKALLEKYLLRSIPYEGEGGAGGAEAQPADTTNNQIATQKAPAFDLNMLNADMNDRDEQIEDYIVSDTNEPTEVPDDGGEDGEGEDGKEKPGKDEKPAESKKAAEKSEEAKGDDDKEGELPGWMKRRMDRQERKHAREMQELRDKIEAKPAEDKGAADPGPKPVASDYPDFETYLEAKTAWETADKAAKKAAKEKPTADADKDKGGNQPDTELIEAIEDIREALGDDKDGLWDKVKAKGDLQITRDMAVAMADLDNPGAVLKQLYDKPELADEISKMTPRRQAIRLAKLDAKAPATTPAADDKGKGKTPPPKKSAAPPPIETPEGGNKTGVPEGYDTENFSTFEKQRDEDARRGSSGGDLWL